MNMIEMGKNPTGWNSAWFTSTTAAVWKIIEVGDDHSSGCSPSSPDPGLRIKFPAMTTTIWRGGRKKGGLSF